MKLVESGTTRLLHQRTVGLEENDHGCFDPTRLICILQKLESFDSISILPCVSVFSRWGGTRCWASSPSWPSATEYASASGPLKSFPNSNIKYKCQSELKRREAMFICGDLSLFDRHPAAGPAPHQQEDIWSTFAPPLPPLVTSPLLCSNRKWNWSIPQMKPIQSMNEKFSTSLDLQVFRTCQRRTRLQVEDWKTRMWRSHEVADHWLLRVSAT